MDSKDEIVKDARRTTFGILGRVDEYIEDFAAITSTSGIGYETKILSQNPILDPDLKQELNLCRNFAEIFEKTTSGLMAPTEGISVAKELIKK